MPKDTAQPRTGVPRLRRPTATDGADIWALVRRCKPLDENSMYANLIQADHFRDTCVVADLDGEIVGWVSGHMIPDRRELFVWQVAVGEKAVVSGSASGCCSSSSCAKPATTPRT